MDRKKMLLIFGAAWVSAALLTWFLWARTKAPKSENMVACVAATKDLPAGTKLKKTDVKMVRIPEKSLVKTAVLDEAMALDRVLLFPVSANETLTNAKLTSTARAEGLASTIEPGMRAISVQINDASGVSGLIQPRSKVDVLFTRPGSLAEAVTSTILEDITVLSIGRVTEVSQNAVPGAARPANTAATLIVTPEQAKKIELAKNEGKISLSLRNPLDHSDSLDTAPTTAEALNVGDFAGRARRRNGPNMRDPKAWDKLTGDDEFPKVKVVEKKEPPKPRLVVDVYRGEKHVQEIFQ